MGFWQHTCLSACTVGLGLVLGGCEPSTHSAADDEREPHFLLGQNRVKAKDFMGAVEAFESSLEANPHSAAAHFQLAMLYEDEATNPAAAIYHYEQYLRYEPKASNAEIVAGHINSCKLQLAKDVADLPSSSSAIQQLQVLADKNRQLQEEVDKWKAYSKCQNAAAKTNSPAAPDHPAVQAAAPVIPAAPANADPPTGKSRTHTVAAGETPAAIARKLGLNLNALLAANPGLNPKKLHVGQVIYLPPP